MYNMALACGASFGSFGCMKIGASASSVYQVIGPAVFQKKMKAQQ